METFYSNEKNAQILIALLKEHGIRKIIASPGSANAAFVASVQHDNFFKVYSSVDERSAAYMACGLAAESGEPVVISCTGATASRNYLPGLTEAFYRKLPVLSITSTNQISKIGHNIAQVIDRTVMPIDVAKRSILLPIVNNSEEFWDCEMKVNQAILDLKRNGGGPVHLNLPTNYDLFNTKELPKVRIIHQFSQDSEFPKLPEGKIAIFVGSHVNMPNELTSAIDGFCESNNAIVLCDHSSGYKGKYRVLHSLLSSQINKNNNETPDLIIHIGEVTGDYSVMGLIKKEVWRVNEDGEIRDTFKKLSKVFEMPEKTFFENYVKKENKSSNSYLIEYKNRITEINNIIPEIPFSNIWFASKMAHKIPENSTIHFAILNSLRTWNFFELPNSVSSSSNVGGFGIDGCISSLIGASLNDKNKIFYGVTGDLAFFYDMNVLGNRHVGNNVRLLLVNNGVGTEFRQFNHRAAQFGNDADEFIAAAGHYGNKSPLLIKNYAENLGFEYISASTKSEFEGVYQRFLEPKITEKPILFEVFTNNIEESEALEIMMNIEEGDFKSKAKKAAKNFLGDKKIGSFLKSIKK